MPHTTGRGGYVKQKRRPFEMDDWGYDERRNWYERSAVRPAASSPSAVLPYPHYTDEYWNTARLIWGQECKTAECNYSDRLWQWNYEAAERAGQAVKGMPDTAARAEKWLSAYHERPVILRYIMAGCNASSGFAYYVYGYDYAEE